MTLVTMSLWFFYCSGYTYSFLLLNRSRLNNSSIIEGCLLHFLLGTFFFFCYYGSFIRIYGVWWVVSFWRVFTENSSSVTYNPTILWLFCMLLDQYPFFYFLINISCGESYPFADPLGFVWLSTQRPLHVDYSNDFLSCPCNAFASFIFNSSFSTWWHIPLRLHSFCFWAYVLLA